MNLKEYDIIAIVGPTAVGKTAYSIKLAKELNGEIINGDATQIYRGMNIGSAKITTDEMEGVVHHLIDIKDVDEQYTVADFQKDCREKIASIQKRGKTPIICGGSGLYIQAALYNYHFDPRFKREKSKYNDYNDEQILLEFKQLYPKNEDNIDVANAVRVRNYMIRKDLGLEIENEGLSSYYSNFKIIGLTCERSILHQRISKRVDMMFANGLIDEVKQFDENLQSQSAIGYKEVHAYLRAEISLEEAQELIKRNTRRFAKRQYTWFNNKMDVIWYDSLEEIWL